jgi:hypothetical protein
VRVALLLLLSGATIAVAGCGTTSQTANSAALGLQREDLLAVSRALRTAEPSVARELAAARAAWPLVAHGLHADSAAIARSPVDAAAKSSATIELPALLQESQAASLTGPAAQLAGLFRNFSVLAALGWRMTRAAIDQVQQGSATEARFARGNVALYIESVYDAHYELAQLGKQLLNGYRALGGPHAFGGSLTQEEVDALARAYSETADRLHPHVGVRLGS